MTATVLPFYRVQITTRRPAMSAARSTALLCLCLLLPAQPPRAGPIQPAPPAASAATASAAPAPASLWLAGDAAQARQAVALLEAAAEHGLDPAHYRAAELAQALAAPRGPDADAALARALDGAMLRYLADLHGGRAPLAYRAGTPAPPWDAAAVLGAALRGGRLAQAVEEAAPAIPLYARVRAGLARYRALAQAHPDWPPLPPPGPAGTTPGAAYPGAALLRERLRLLGDLAPGDEPGGEAQYGEQDGEQDQAQDGVVPAQALARFQARHGLVPDGVPGPLTLAALAVPPARRAVQLGLTLERLRWLPALAPGPMVAVNLPAYRLWAFDSRDAAAAPLEMRIIVGKAAAAPTPLFVGTLRYLELNPYWNVPHSIAVKEILPRLARQPGYLRGNDMEIVDASGRVLPAAGPAALAAVRAGTARIRQRPGPRNVLGALKFAMPNPMDIYLHATSAQELFARSRRDLSHGCIRVEAPLALAQFVLADPARWNGAALEAAIRSGRTRTLNLPAPVPVVLFYATAVADRAGRVLFADDIYGLDPALERALAAP